LTASRTCGIELGAERRGSHEGSERCFHCLCLADGGEHVDWHLLASSNTFIQIIRVERSRSARQIESNRSHHDGIQKAKLVKKCRSQQMLLGHDVPPHLDAGGALQQPPARLLHVGKL